MLKFYNEFVIILFLSAILLIWLDPQRLLYVFESTSHVKSSILSMLMNNSQGSKLGKQMAGKTSQVLNLQLKQEPDLIYLFKELVLM